MNSERQNIQPRKKLFAACKWLIGLSILAYLFVKFNGAEVIGAMAAADLILLVGGLLLLLLSRLLHALQTTLAITHLHVPAAVSQTLAINLISSFYNLFLPGEVGGGTVKWYRLSKASGMRAEVFAAIVFLRLMDTGCIAVFGVLGLLIDNPFDSPSLFRGGVVLLAAILAGFFSLFFKPAAKSLEKLLGFASGWLPTVIQEKLDKVSCSFFHFQNLPPRHLLAIMITPVFGLACYVLALLFTAMSLDLTVPLFSLIWICAMVSFIQMIPATISGLGIREGALIYLLPLYGVAPAKAMAFSLLLFGYTLAIGLIGGMLEAKEQLFNSIGAKKDRA